MIEPSPELIVVSSHAELTLTKARLHEDYSVWLGNRIVAQGGRALTETIFQTRKTEMTVTSQSNTQPINIEHRVEQYIKLRNAIKEKDEAHKLAMEPYRETLEKLNGILLQHLQNIGGDSVKTTAGTVYKTVKKSASLEDPDQFMRHVIGTENWDLLERKASLKAVEDFVAEHGVLPPGVKFSSTQVVGVRKA